MNITMSIYIKIMYCLPFSWQNTARKLNFEMSGVVIEWPKRLHGIGSVGQKA